MHSFIVASFNAQSVKGNDMACKRCEISTFIKDNGVDLFFVTETWLSPHWLPVKVRSTYKIACLCYHCRSSTAPSYVTDMLHKKPLHTRNTRSSSYTMPLLNRPAHSKATLGDRSFSFASSSVRNSIPNDVRCAPSLSSFKSRLKTYLYRSVYID